MYPLKPSVGPCKQLRYVSGIAFPMADVVEALGEVVTEQTCKDGHFEEGRGRVRTHLDIHIPEPTGPVWKETTS